MYTQHNYKSKKEIKVDIALLATFQNVAPNEQAEKEVRRLSHRLTCYQPNNIFGTPTEGTSMVIEGPHYPAPHRFYGQGHTDEHGVLISLK